LLESPARPPCFVEVKNVTLVRNKTFAEFPDSVTARGAKHLDELIDQVALGNRAVMLYLAQRGDCTSFAAAGDIDPAYAKGLIAARRAGVEILAYCCRVSAKEIKVAKPMSYSAFTGN
jgi:sugar fermentation stimulation protein A